MRTGAQQQQVHAHGRHLRMVAPCWHQQLRQARTYVPPSMHACRGAAPAAWAYLMSTAGATSRRLLLMVNRWVARSWLPSYSRSMLMGIAAAMPAAQRAASCWLAAHPASRLLIYRTPSGAGRQGTIAFLITVDWPSSHDVASTTVNARHLQATHSRVPRHRRAQQAQLTPNKAYRCHKL